MWCWTQILTLKLMISLQWHTSHSGRYGNLYLDKIMSPQLTSVDQMAFHGCKVGLSILLEKMKNFAAEDMPVFMEYKPRHHVRGTTVKE